MKKVDIKVEDMRLLPTRATNGSAGYDLRANIEEEIIFKPNESKMFSTGIKLDIKDPNIALFVMPRSGFSCKQEMILLNSIGLIDSDYQGDIKIVFKNISNKEVTIKPFDRVGQMVFVPVFLPELNLVQEFESKTERGSGGFGSTGLS